MQAEYKRDMNHNYLVIHAEQAIDTASYQVRMLVGNSIPSLLKCRVQGMDGAFMVYYDVTSRQSLASLFEDKKLKYPDLQMIFGGFMKVLEEMSEYLLNPGRLVLQPEFLFVDVEKREMYFCCRPDYEKDVRCQFQELTEYLLPKLDHEDQKAVMLGYGIYRRAMDDSFRLEYIKEELYREYGEESDREPGEKAGNSENLFERKNYEEGSPGEAEAGFYGKKQAEAGLFGKKKTEAGIRGKKQTEIGIREKKEKGAGPYERKRAEKYSGGQPTEQNEPEFDWSEGNLFASQGDSLKEENTGEEGKVFWKQILFCVIGALLALGVFFAKLLGYLPGIELQALLGGVLAFAGVGILIFAVGQKEKKREQPGLRQQLDSAREKAMDARREENNREAAWEIDDLGAEKSSDHGRNAENENFFEKKCDNSEFHTYNNGKRLGQEEKEKKSSGNFGETVVLSAGALDGPATLVSREPGELATIYLQEELTVIGKLENAADAVIDLPTVSRIHAKIRCRDGEYYLTDLNSRNGTSVNGKMLLPDQDYCLQDQDQVDFAQARYVFIR